ncbi:serine hydrolase domain-containing protein [Streptomyces sp. NPDC127106]|uniref:serine hydrolase domain-containing protein n=1 Tax=Streptomyces sp. NPDC127106 TaxID=3345360 RepID=UPI00363875DF
MTVTGIPAAAQPGPSSGTPFTDDRLRTLLAGSAPGHDVPGAAIAVSFDGVLRSAALGTANARVGLEMTADTLFPVGSFGKVWTATLVMQLVDEGLIGLDDPVRQHLPDFAVADEEAARTVTVRQLLTHTAGFYGDSFQDFGPGHDAPARYVASLAGAAQLHPPGALFSYSNSGYVVLGHLVTTVRGGTWDDQVRARIVRPLGLRDVALDGDDVLLHRNSVGHVVGGNGKPRIIPRSERIRAGVAAGSMLRLSVESAVAFCEAQRSGGRTPGGKELLGAESAALMVRPWAEVPGAILADRWGIGWALWDWNGTGVFGHDGEYRGQAILIRCVPEHGLTLALAVNGGRARDMYDDVVPALVEELTGVRAPRTAWEPEGPAAVDPARYTGTFSGPDARFTVVPAPDGEALLITTEQPDRGPGQEGAVPDRYVRLSGDTFLRDPSKRGSYRTVCFVGEPGAPAAYLHNSRAYARS